MSEGHGIMVKNLRTLYGDEGMKCEEALQMVTPYIENRLQPRELEELIAHVKACPSCYDELETYFIVDEAIRYLDDEKSEAYNITEMLRKDMQMKERWLRRRKLLFGLCGLCILLLLGLFGLGVLHYLDAVNLPFLPGK